jgi:hypothetical protein
LEDVSKRVNISLDNKREKTVGKYQVKMTKIFIVELSSLLLMSSETFSKVLAVLATKSLFVAEKVGKFRLKGRLHAKCWLKRVQRRLFAADVSHIGCDVLGIIA